MTENKRMSISGLLDVLDTGISLSTSHIEYAIQCNILEDLSGCLKELEQYRAIGTVEQLEWCKDASHWKELFKEKLEKYEAIGTIEEFKALKEKNVAKKPMPIDYEKYIGVIENAKFLRGAYWCPNCKHTVRSGAYCDDCGQKLDWQ